MTGWGQDGPLAQAAGHDLNYIAPRALSGFRVSPEVCRHHRRPWSVISAVGRSISQREFSPVF
jgi:hypothetical protein